MLCVSSAKMRELLVTKLFILEEQSHFGQKNCHFGSIDALQSQVGLLQLSSSVKW